MWSHRRARVQVRLRNPLQRVPYLNASVMVLPQQRYIKSQCYLYLLPFRGAGSREAAFVHATLSAGIMYSVSRACREGLIPACGCSRPSSAPISRQLRAQTTRAAGWQWGGCSDNTEYGYRFTTSFVDARQREKNYPRHSTALKHMLMNLHNNDAGRLVWLRLAAYYGSHNK